MKHYVADVRVWFESEDDLAAAKRLGEQFASDIMFGSPRVMAICKNVSLDTAGGEVFRCGLPGARSERHGYIAFDGRVMRCGICKGIVE